MARRSSTPRLLASGNLPAQNVLWNGVSDFLSNAMKPEVGLTGAIHLVNFAIAGPVLAVAVACGACRFLKGKRDEAADRAFREQIADFAKRAAEGQDVLQDIADGTIPLNVEVDDLVKMDIASFVDTALGSSTSQMREGFRQELEEALNIHPQVTQVNAELEVLRVLAWTNDARGRRLEARIQALELDLQARTALTDPSLRRALESQLSRFFGHPIGVLQDEPAWRPDLLSPDHTLLIYGPPRVGKSCWVLRAAIEWLTGTSADGTEVIYFNATERTSRELAAHVSRRSDAKQLLIIVDDFHFGRQAEKESWIDAILDSRVKRSGSNLQTRSWIVSRNGEDGHFLRRLRDMEVQNEPIEYPIDRVIEMYLGERAPSAYFKDQMFIAGLVGRLDPALPRMLYGKSPANTANDEGESRWSNIQADVHEAERRATDEWLDWVSEKGALSAYKACLPLASLDLAASYALYQLLLPSIFDDQFVVMRREGLATEDNAGRVKLLEHPFQVRRTLSRLAARRDRDIPSGLLEAYGRQIAGVSPPTAVIAAYILSDDWDGQVASGPAIVERVELLQDHAEWTGFRDVLADALDELCTHDGLWNLVPPDARPSIRASTLKVRRLATPSINALGEQQAEWKVRLDRIHDGIDHDGRADHVLYEIGYIDYLLGNRDLAIEVLDESVRESVACVIRNLSEDVDIGSREWIHGWMALANVWVTYLVRETAKIEKDALSSEPLGVWRESASAAAKLFQLLNKANTMSDGSGPLYADALVLVCPQYSDHDWSSVRLERPSVAGQGDSSDSARWIRRVLQVLGDKELQCWYDWKEFEWWPWIFGLDAPPSTGVPDDVELSPLVRNRTSAASQLRMFKACAAYASGDALTMEGAMHDAISACLQYRSTGRIESLGTYLATVHRMSRHSDSEWADAAVWAIRNLVPATGHAELARQLVARTG